MPRLRPPDRLLVVTLTSAVVFAGLPLHGCAKKTASIPAERATTPRQESLPAPATATQANADDEQRSGDAGPRRLRASPSGKVELVSGVAGGPAAPAISDEIAGAAADNRRALVYVGAPWCAPCVRFKKALLKGDLDSALPGFRFIEFDADRDLSRLNQAGYNWRLVPFFGAPGFDGTSAGRSTAGVPSKDAPIGPLVERVAALLEEAPETAREP
jgi:hypothetical protein